MPYRPLPEYRRKVHRVIYPLTAAIQAVYGNRSQDGGRPIGAFYDVHVSSQAWHPLGGIWYRPVDEGAILARRIDSALVGAFARGILTGTPLELDADTVIRWEPVPSALALQLPPPL